MSVGKGTKLYETFHQFGPRSLHKSKSFRIPARVVHVGEAKCMYYTSDKLHPNTGIDEGLISYYHPHEGGVKMCLSDHVSQGYEGSLIAVPKFIRDCTALVKLGSCDGFDFETFNGELIEGRSKGKKPDWYCIPSGKAILSIQDRKTVLAIAWGGDLHVEWRGVVG